MSNRPIQHFPLQFLAAAVLFTLAAYGQGLKPINSPNAGKIVCGEIQGQSTEAGAMAAILRSVHQNTGQRPKVGKLFQARGSESVATFFTVTGGKGKPLSGMIIVAKVSNDRVEGALLTDDADRFAKSLSPMLQTLFRTWRPFPPEAKPGGATSPATLRQTTVQDGSASIGLADGWRLVPQMSMKGSIVALGPHDESAELGITFLAEDTNNPHVQQTIRALRAGQLRNSVYANATYYPYGGDLSKAFVYMMQSVRQKARLSPAAYNFTSVIPVPAPQERCVRMAGTADLHDGKGARELNAVYCTTPPSRFGTWMSEAYTTMAPMQVAANERPTLGAILQSFRVNMNVVNAQAARISAPAIDQIHAIGREAANQAAAAHAREDIQNSSVYKHWDDMDKRSQEFENYQLGYSVVSDTGNNVHATLWNDDAEALVKNNPDRFEYVTAPNYWKGVDY
jgi:hypothetical protein